MGESMKDKILSVLKSCKGRGDYYGITPIELLRMLPFCRTAEQQKKWYEGILDLEKENKIYLTCSTQENNRREIVLICYRDN